ncbi:MAG: hypothetical protein KQJ78_14830 [Deltaproteobacteria bacterium]|nr:hypothetical protein [Deltaproteobacteria bacterium]MCB2187694.1 hypothetical protein [Deltaproteobacteria bacterium]
MERQVILRDRQEGQAADINNIQLFVDQSLQHLIMDAITTERMFVGLGVTSPTATEIEIAAGRLWDGPTGKVFRKDQAERLSIFSHLPVTDEKWLAVAVIGNEIETDIQPRDFLIDLETMQKEPRTVAMELRREVVTYIQPGLESPDPMKPEPPTGYTLVAYVRLSPGGVQEIALAENKQLMNLFDTWQLALANNTWIGEMGARIDAMFAELAALAALIKGLTRTNQLTELVKDVAYLKDLSNLPDTYSSYGADSYLTPDESAETDPEYHALVEEGIRFPFAGQTEQQPALFNPYETAVINFGGLVLPAHSQVARLTTTGKTGEIAIGTYQYQTHTLKMAKQTYWRLRYGPERVICTNQQENAFLQGAKVGQVFDSPWDYGKFEVLQSYNAHDVSGVSYNYVRIRYFWKDLVEEPYYWLEDETHTVNGSQIGQTFLATASGWLTRIELCFSAVAATGDVYVHVVEADVAGVPNRSRGLGYTSLAPSDLHAMPGRTVFVLPKPVFIQAGKRYALLITTAGNHTLATVDGSAYTNGTLFQSTDGAYFQGDLTKDLMMRLWYAQFNNARTTVDLTPLSLSDGIADLDFILQGVNPANTQVVFEYQRQGDASWYGILADTADQLRNLPAMVKLRAVFTGSREVMPGLTLPGSKLRANRMGTEFTHVSTARTLAAASDDINVMLRLEGWDAAKHTCTASLTSGGSTYAPAGVTDVVMTDGPEPTIQRTFNFQPLPGTGISAYQIKIEGTTTTVLDVFHVAKRWDWATN